MGKRDEESRPLLAVGSKEVLVEKRRVNLSRWWEWVWTRYTEPFEPERDSSFWYTTTRATKEDPAPWLADLYAFPNWSLASHYVNTGIALNLLTTPVTFYLVESKNASSAVVNTYTALTYLPWCLKVFFGLQSDLVPWLGMHRRSYYVLGWLVFLASNVALAALARPSVAATLLLTFVMVMGCLLADTVADAIVLECTTAGESARSTGKMRTHAYIVRQVGSTLGSLLGAVVYNARRDGGTWSWGLSIAQCFALQALLVALTVFPLVPFMYELPAKGAQRRAADLWRAAFDFVANPGVAVPLFYLYFYNVCFVSNPAWTNFLYDGLGFSDFQVGVLSTIGSLFSVAGLAVYERYFFNTAWRPLYVWTTLIAAAFSGLQVLLVLRLTFGLPNIVFATGDTSMQDFVSVLVFLPTCIMFFGFIPPGTEGTTYALLTTWQNVAATVAYDLGTALNCGFNTSNSALENGNWSGVLALTVITSLVQLLPAALVYLETPSGLKLLPNSIAETKRQCDLGRRSDLCAYIFIFLFFGSIFATVAQALYVIFYPAAC